jgi:hypothetical protein
MALLATIEGGPRKVAAADTENHILLDSQGYTIMHDGVDVSNTPDLNTIYISDTPGITASAAAGEKLALVYGRYIEVPDKWRAVYFVTAAGAPTFSVLPKRGR